MSEGTPVNTGVSWPDPVEADLLGTEDARSSCITGRAPTVLAGFVIFNLVYDPVSIGTPQAGS
jgi:hypothetical protein